MKKVTDRQRGKALGAIAAIPDEQIDTSDIPEPTDEQFGNTVLRGDKQLTPIDPRENHEG